MNDFLTNLPAWDGEPRLQSFLEAAAPPEHPPMDKATARLVGILKRSIEWNEARRRNSAQETTEQTPLIQGSCFRRPEIDPALVACSDLRPLAPLQPPAASA